MREIFLLVRIFLNFPNIHFFNFIYQMLSCWKFLKQTLLFFFEIFLKSQSMFNMFLHHVTKIKVIDNKSYIIEKTMKIYIIFYLYIFIVKHSFIWYENIFREYHVKLLSKKTMKELICLWKCCSKQFMRKIVINAMAAM